MHKPNKKCSRERKDQSSPDSKGDSLSLTCRHKISASLVNCSFSLQVHVTRASEHQVAVQVFYFGIGEQLRQPGIYSSHSKYSSSNNLI